MNEAEPTFPAVSGTTVKDTGPCTRANRGSRGYSGSAGSCGANGELVSSLTVGCARGICVARYIEDGFSSDLGNKLSYASDSRPPSISGSTGTAVLRSPAGVSEILFTEEPEPAERTRKISK